MPVISIAASISERIGISVYLRKQTGKILEYKKRIAAFHFTPPVKEKPL
jgi:hypothetical protein